jgi:ATP-dependent DNA helicase DinG
VTDLADVFSAQGALARAIEAFKPRPMQVEMAQAVAEAISRGQVLVAEAGTGTGKTFAYLVPALLSGGKVIVSTGTKTLQDQLFDRDIPTVRRALSVPVSVALLKGRSNYLCHYYLRRALNEGSFPNRQDAYHLANIQGWAEGTASGDKADLADVPENAGIWSYVTSTRDNCLGAECEFFDRCFVMKARKAALEADVVVVNHHLFFADVALRDEGVAELLPSCNTVIFDEAHQLPETASLFFGESLSTAQLVELARDTRLTAVSEAKDFAALPADALALDRAARDLRLVFREDSGRYAYGKIAGNHDFQRAVANVDAKLGLLIETLTTQTERGEGLAKCLERAHAAAALLTGWRDDEREDHVRWVELLHHALHLNATPLSVAKIFREQIENNARSWIFTSATLSVGGDFSHYCGELGLPEAATRSWESPFDFARQALLCIPEGLPEPNSSAHTRAVVEAALPVIEAAGGRTFLLFTSLRAMREGQALVEDFFQRRGWDYPILAQGQGSRTELLSRFRTLGNAVLVGSQSFWEGVDVRGEALSVVVIDKLPFAPPDDPVLAARIDKLNREGRSAFLEYQLPQAAITLKQGAGRLIRDDTDRGVLMICDPRLLTKGYGKKLLASLPPMRRTRSVADAVQFFA